MRSWFLARSSKTLRTFRVSGVIGPLDDALPTFAMSPSIRTVARTSSGPPKSSLRSCSPRPARNLVLDGEARAGSAGWTLQHHVTRTSLRLHDLAARGHPMPGARIAANAPMERTGLDADRPLVSSRRLRELLSQSSAERGRGGRCRCRLPRPTATAGKNIGPPVPWWRKTTQLQAAQEVALHRLVSRRPMKPHRDGATGLCGVKHAGVHLAVRRLTRAVTCTRRNVTVAAKPRADISTPADVLESPANKNRIHTPAASRLSERKATERARGVSVRPDTTRERVRVLEDPTCLIRFGFEPVEQLERHPTHVSLHVRPSMAERNLPHQPPSSHASKRFPEATCARTA
jgi:hypothetical protein